MIEIHLLEQLEAFAKYGTLSAAAEHLHTSQPALTRSMKKLEDDLGVTLFIRSKNKLELNEVGLKAAEYASFVLQSDRDFESKVQAYSRNLHTLSIGFCSPVPQNVLIPIINTIFEGMTVSFDMMDDSLFLDRLLSEEYQLAVVHKKPEGDEFYYKKCGHEDLYISLTPSDPLTFYPQIHLSDLDGRSILLLSSIGFWANQNQSKMPNVKYLLQIDQSSFEELAENSAYPSFTSSYYINQGLKNPGKIDIPIVDKECHTDYYLVCLKKKKDYFEQLFDHIHNNTIH